MTFSVNNQLCLDEKATHVVVETTYGCNALLLFTKTNSSKSEEKVIAGKLQVAIMKVSYLHELLGIANFLCLSLFLR